jgi:hypothetical protein
MPKCATQVVLPDVCGNHQNHCRLQYFGCLVAACAVDPTLGFFVNKANRLICAPQRLVSAAVSLRCGVFGRCLTRTVEET